MFDLEVKMEPGSINVQTTSERGHTSEELAANAVAKIINIADSADPVLRQQAEMFRERMFHVIVHALNQGCLLYTSPSPRDKRQSRMPSSA